MGSLVSDDDLLLHLYQSQLSKKQAAMSYDSVALHKSIVSPIGTETNLRNLVMHRTSFHRGSSSTTSPEEVTEEADDTISEHSAECECQSVVFLFYHSSFNVFVANHKSIILIHSRWPQAKVPGSSSGGDSPFFLQTFSFSIPSTYDNSQPSVFFITAISRISKVVIGRNI